MTPHWKRHLYRVADLLLKIPAGSFVWPSENFEPLTLAIFFPFIRHTPWQLRRCPSFIELERLLSRMWKSGDNTQGVILRQLRSTTSKLDSMQKGMVWEMLQSLSSFGISCE